MDQTTLYGIPNCDSMKKARAWLSAQGIDYHFHNYKKEGIAEDTLRAWVAQVGWEVLLNRRGMLWRKVSPEDKATINEANAIQLMLATPSMIKRPVLQHATTLHAGFAPAEYARIFSATTHV